MIFLWLRHISRSSFLVPPSSIITPRLLFQHIGDADEHGGEGGGGGADA